MTNTIETTSGLRAIVNQVWQTAERLKDHPGAYDLAIRAASNLEACLAQLERGDHVPEQGQAAKAT